jgi:hypothetical protein
MAAFLKEGEEKLSLKFLKETAKISFLYTEFCLLIQSSHAMAAAFILLVKSCLRLFAAARLLTRKTGLKYQHISWCSISGNLRASDFSRAIFHCYGYFPIYLKQKAIILSL